MITDLNGRPSLLYLWYLLRLSSYKTAAYLDYRVEPRNAFTADDNPGLDDPMGVQAPPVDYHLNGS